MPTAPIHIIANPVSGRGRGRARAQELFEVFSASNHTKVHWTKERGDGRRLAGLALEQGASTVVACGGDGTMQEVATMLAHTGVRMVPAPFGKCNDFTDALNLSDEPEAIAAAARGRAAKPVDLVQHGSGYYCTVGAVGFDAEISRFVDNMNGFLKGTPAYIYGVLRVLSRYQPSVMDLTWDGGSHHGPLLLVAVANSKSYGGQIPIAPRAVPDDGVLDLVLVQPVSLPRLMVLLPILMKGKHEGIPEARFVRSKKVTIISDRPVELWADGEPVSQSPITLEVNPGALNLGVAD